MLSPENVPGGGAGRAVRYLIGLLATMSQRPRKTLGSDVQQTYSMKLLR